MPDTTVSGISVTWDYCVLCGKKTTNVVQNEYYCVNCHFIYVGFSKKP